MASAQVVAKPTRFESRKSLLLLFCSSLRFELLVFFSLPQNVIAHFSEIIGGPSKFFPRLVGKSIAMQNR